MGLLAKAHDSSLGVSHLVLLFLFRLFHWLFLLELFFPLKLGGPHRPSSLFAAGALMVILRSFGIACQ
jgi:hypothetical protein